MTNTQTTTKPDPLRELNDYAEATQCAECGHLHYVIDYGQRCGYYAACPLASEGCECPL